MKILITGATGYIGNQLANKLAEQEEEINVLVRDTDSVNLPFGKNINVFKGDITDPVSIDIAMKGCVQVYHCAAIAKLSASNQNIFQDVNVTGTKNILQSALKAHIRKLVFTSSAAVLGPSAARPLTEKDSRIEPFESEYDLSKHLAENLVREYVKKGLNAVIVNPSRVFGPGPATYSNAVNRMILHMLSKKIVLLPGIGKYISNYCYIDDVVNGHMQAMERGWAGENYILGGENVSYDRLLHTIRGYGAPRNLLLKLPVPLLKGVAFISRLVNRNSELTPSLITRFAKNRMLSNEKAIRNIGYRITPFDEGIKATIAFLHPAGNKTTNTQFKLFYYGKNKISTRTR